MRPQLKKSTKNLPFISTKWLTLASKKPNQSPTFSKMINRGSTGELASPKENIAKPPMLLQIFRLVTSCVATIMR
jgi:hypothetical protein